MPLSNEPYIHPNCPEIREFIRELGLSTHDMRANAAALLDDRWTLIDATMPYRKWHGFDCPHKEYKLLEPAEFHRRMREIEARCFTDAKAWHDEKYAGLLYAPWIHEDIALDTPNRHDTVFYLLILNAPGDWTLYVSYIIYTEASGRIPIMASVTQDKELFQFSVNPAS